jgi:hypothetical protein
MFDKRNKRTRHGLSKADSLITAKSRYVHLYNCLSLSRHRDVLDLAP